MSCFGSSVEILIILSIVSSLSIIINVIIILICILGQVLDELTSYSVICMAVNDILRSIALLLTAMSEISTSPLCKVIGYICCFTMISNLFLGFSISHNLYQLIIQENYNFESNKKIWFIIAYPILALFQSLPFITDSYGFNGTLCTLKDDQTSNLWRLYNFYVPCWIVTVFIILAYFRIYLKLKQKRQSRAAIDLIINRGYIYPVILILLVAFLTVYRILQEFGSWCAIDKLGISAEYMLASHGILDGIAFFTNSNVRRALKEKFYHRFRSTCGIFSEENLIFQLKDGK